MELLAPAGSLQKLKYAFNYGADAVYCGTPDFSLRARANNFTPEDLKKGIAYAQKRNKQVFVAFNIYPHNAKLEAMEKTLPSLMRLKPNAIIISDPGVLMLVRKKYPRAVIHLSTQANAINYGAVAFWKKQGVQRIILARETTIKEIGEIKAKVPGIELEYFVHGALCMAYSGRCLLSSWINDRSANEGDCTQPCRWPWQATISTDSVRKNKREKKVSAILEEDQHGSYILNSRDLCLIEHLTALKKSGVDCLKIEGRNKSLYYVTTVTKYYAKALAALEKGEYNPKSPLIKEALQEFSQLGNRQYTTGFAFEGKDPLQNYKSSSSQGSSAMVGEYLSHNQAPVRAALQKKSQHFIAPIKVHNSIKAKSFVDVLSPESLEKMQVKNIFNDQGEAKPSAHGGTSKVWYIEFNKPLPEWAIIRSNN